jgi:hypothetical protein
MPQSADIVLVVDYAPFRHFPLGTFRKYFRFKGIYTDNWRWTRTPLAGIEDEVKRKIDSHLMVIKKMPDRAN